MKTKSVDSLAQLSHLLEDGIDQYGVGKVLNELAEVFDKQSAFYQKQGAFNAAKRYRFYCDEINTLIDKSDKLCGI
jgi:lactate dehydrogenase-like 2-hydroxyacid dehydrogenase